MKKTYINPTLEVIQIASQTQVLTGSVTISTLDGLGDFGGEISDASADAREFELDDFETYDEEDF